MYGSCTWQAALSTVSSKGQGRGRGGATAARLIMRATLAIKTTEAISNVESAQGGREREEQIRLAFRYRRKIAAAFSKKAEGRGGGLEVDPGRRVAGRRL